MGVLRYDKASPLSKPVRLPNGFVRAEGYLTRSGIFVYRDAQGKTVRELRPPEEVMHADSLASFGMMPVTNEHPDGGNSQQTAWRERISNGQCVSNPSGGTAADSV